MISSPQSAQLDHLRLVFSLDRLFRGSISLLRRLGADENRPPDPSHLQFSAIPDAKR